MKRHVFVAILLGSVTVAVFAQAPEPKPQATQPKPQAGAETKPQAGPLLDSSRLFLQIEQAGPSGTTPVFGSPAQPGMYVTRERIAANTKNRPRYYDQDRWVTVLKGTWWVGKGDVFRQDKLTAVREGGMMYQPANFKYYDTAGTGEVLLQVMGIGPVKPTHAEVDAAGQPVALGGPYPEDMEEGGGRRRRRLAQPPVIPDPDNPDPPRGTQLQDQPPQQPQQKPK